MCSSDLTAGVVAAAEPGRVRVTPPLNFFGLLESSYEISDGDSTSSAALVIDVRSVNDAPTARPDTATVLQGDTVALNVLTNDSDIEEGALTLVSVDEPSEGTLRFGEDGGVEFTAPELAEGPIELTYVMQDEDGAQESTALTFLVERRQRPALTLSKTSVTAEVEPGGELVYELRYENGGDGSAVDLEIEDELPALLRFVSADPSPNTVDGQRLVWSLGDLAAGASGQITLTTSVAEEATGDEPIANSALARMSNPPPGAPDSTVTATDSIQVIVRYPNIALNKQAISNSVKPGENLVYELRYENEGEGAAVDFEIEDELPALLRFVSADPVPSSVDGQRLVWSLGEVAPGSSGLITLTTSVADEATGEESIANSALARMSNPPPGAPDSTVTATDSVDVVVL